jgi:hypothetical protein
VFVNGERVGTTPLVLNGVPVGSRALRVVLDGYQPWTSGVRVVANQRATIVAGLQARVDLPAATIP